MSEKLQLPKSNVKRIMKLNDDVKVVSADAVVASSKATELFLGELATKAYQIAVANNRKTVKLEDIMAAARMNPRQMDFLDECFSVKK